MNSLPLENAKMAVHRFCHRPRPFRDFLKGQSLFTHFREFCPAPNPFSIEQIKRSG
jgi:hypothetical protein